MKMVVLYVVSGQYRIECSLSSIAVLESLISGDSSEVMWVE